MPLHPVEARWFEVHVPRDQTVHALEVLADSAGVEIEEKDPLAPPCVDAESLTRKVLKFERTAARYQHLLPKDEHEALHLIESPEQTAQNALSDLHRWLGELLALKRRLRSQERERDNLALIAQCLEAMGDERESLAAFNGATGFLFKTVYVCPRESVSSPRGADVLSTVYPGKTRDFWVVAGLPEEHDLVARAGILAGCKPLRVPDWLSSDTGPLLPQVQNRLTRLEETVAVSTDALECHLADPGIRETLATARLLRWYLGVSLGGTRDGKACRLSGWTTAAEAGALQQLLQHAGIDATVVLGETRAYQQPPVSLTPKPWARLFRPFVELLGTPGRNEVDPSSVLAVAVPLLFGFMFPDLGHGLILALAGLILQRWRRETLILVPCGLSAAAFGIAFGEVFGLHGILTPLWGYPLDEPLAILLASLAVGVALMLLGLIFAGIEAAWRGETERWLLEGAPVIGIYVATLASLFYPDALVAVGISLLWYGAGILLLCRGQGTGCIAGRIGQLLESALRLALNTLSFLRVGAFALAHAAFSLVVLELMDTVENSLAKGLVFVTGHLFILVFEGAVVMVQTTRLILFEFFIRFLRFEGRIYRPLQPPPHCPPRD